MQKIYKIIFRLKLKYKANIVFDSRLLKENDIFIGLKTRNNNGSLFYKEAIKKKASLVIVNKKINHPKSIYVKDTQIFVKNFCKFILDSYNGKIIAITGSVGKTTFKENIYHILKKNNFATYRSYKNYNNILGLQFSIMNMNLNSNYSIFELGINRSNEMTKLVKTLQPHYCLITGIENSHIGNFKNLNLIFFHQDQVVKLPKNAELLASNSFCTMASFSIDNSVLTLQAHPEFNKDFSLKLLEARKSNIRHKTYLEAVNELETLEHDGELIKPNIIDFLEQKFNK